MSLEDVIRNINDENKKLTLANEKLKIKRKTLGITIAGLFIYPLVNMWLAFWVMLGLGAAHDTWPVIPALGFWTTYLICIAIATLSGFVHHGNRFAVKADKEI